LLTSVLTLAALGLLLLGPSNVTERTWTLVAFGQWNALTEQLAPHAANAFLFEGVVAFFIMTIIVAIRSSAAITSEKEKGTWLALMVTTLSTRDIVAGKYQGILAACVPYLVAHAAVTIPLGSALGLWPTVLAVTGTVLMLLVAVVGGAIGLW